MKATTFTLYPFKRQLKLCLKTLFLGLISSIFIAGIGHAQGSCENLFTLAAERTYNPGTNTTQFVFTITKTGAQQSLSHWGFPFQPCLGTAAQLIDAATAETSTNGTTWVPVSLSYGPDPSTSGACTSGDVLKWNQPMNETTRYFRLTVPGDVQIVIQTVFIKYGNDCCVFSLNFGSCCVDATADAGPNQTICAGATVQLEGAIGGGATQGTWSSSGTGSFSPDANTLNAVYNPSAADITAGTVTLTMTTDDPAGSCEEADDAMTVTINANPAAPVLGKVDPTCTVATGCVTITSSTTGLTFSIDGGAYAAYPTEGWCGLAAGEHCVTVKNGAECISEPACITIPNQPSTPAAPTLSKVDPTCTVATGCVTVTSSTTGLMFSIDGGAYAAYPTEGWCGLAPGEHCVTAKNEAGCISEPTCITIPEQPITPAAPTLGKVDPTCTVATGCVTITSSTTGLLFRINDGDYVAYPTDGWCGLAAGQHCITARNEAGCISEPVCIIIPNQPSTPVAPTLDKVDPTCETGTGCVTVTSSTTGLWFSIDGGAYAAYPTDGWCGLAPGEHCVTAKNEAGCISEPACITIPAQPVCETFTGCTPGYWKNHPGSWGCGYTLTKKFFADVFPGILSNRRQGLNVNLTLNQALSLNGGKYAALARHAVAGLLGACHPGVDYTYNETEIKTAVTSMFNTGNATLGGVLYTNVNALKDELDRVNNLNCPLGKEILTMSRGNNNTIASSEITKGIQVTAYPNPYSKLVKFTIESETGGQATLELVNILGQKQAVVFNGYLFAGQKQVVEYKAPTGAPQNLIYILRTTDKVITGKLIHIDQ